MNTRTGSMRAEIERRAREQWEVVKPSDVEEITLAVVEMWLPLLSRVSASIVLGLVDSNVVVVRHDVEDNARAMEAHLLDMHGWSSATRDTRAALVEEHERMHAGPVDVHGADGPVPKRLMRVEHVHEFDTASTSDTVTP